MKTYKIVLLLVALIPLLIFLWVSRGYDQTATLTPDYSTDTKQLFDDFNNNEQTAIEKYLAKIVSVKGMVKRVQSRNDSIYKVSLSDGSGNTVDCQLQEPVAISERNVTKGSEITVLGEFSGYLKEDLLPGASIQLKRCAITD